MAEQSANELLADDNAQTMTTHPDCPPVWILDEKERRQLRDQHAELTAANDALQALVQKLQWAEWNDSDHGGVEFCTLCRRDKKHGHYDGLDPCELIASLPKKGKQQ